MPISDHDPRVFFAAERTLLAWIRTGLTVMGFGFIVAKFGLFLQFLSLQVPDMAHYAGQGAAGLLGTVFVVVGAAASLWATIQHRRFISALPAQDRPLSYSTRFGLIFGVLIGLLGLFLAMYLQLS